MEELDGTYIKGGYFSFQGVRVALEEIRSVECKSSLVGKLLLVLALLGGLLGARAVYLMLGYAPLPSGTTKDGLAIYSMFMGASTWILIWLEEKYCGRLRIATASQVIMLKVPKETGKRMQSEITLGISQRASS